VSYGWLRERAEASNVFWVSVESDPYQFFSERDEARELFQAEAHRLRGLGLRKFRAEHRKTLAVLASA